MTRGSRHPVSPWHSRARMGPPVGLDAGGPLWVTAVLLGRSLRHRNDRYVDAAFCFGTELNLSISQREQRMILAETHILAGMPLGAALAREDIAGHDRLPAEQLDAESTASRVAP